MGLLNVDAARMPRAVSGISAAASLALFPHVGGGRFDRATVMDDEATVVRAYLLRAVSWWPRHFEDDYDGMQP